jgi:hypothetical protein
MTTMAHITATAPAPAHGQNRATVRGRLAGEADSAGGVPDA